VRKKILGDLLELFWLDAMAEFADEKGCAIQPGPFDTHDYLRT